MTWSPMGRRCAAGSRDQHYREASCLCGAPLAGGPLQVAHTILYLPPSLRDTLWGPPGAWAVRRCPGLDGWCMELLPHARCAVQNVWQVACSATH